MAKGPIFALRGAAGKPPRGGTFHGPVGHAYCRVEPAQASTRLRQGGIPCRTTRPKKGKR
jgi:hypothetical protein